MVTYQFEVDDETWEMWKGTIPRSKAIHARLVELIEADLDGRVWEETERPPRARSTASADTHGPSVASDPDAESAASARSESGEGSEHPGERERDDTDSAESRSLREEMEAALGSIDVPGHSAQVEYKRREAVKWAWEYLRETDGVVQSREIANATFGQFFDEPVDYSTSPRYPGYGLWDGCVRDSLKQLPGVVAPGPRGSRWRFEES